jgi:hypothetical protein
LRILVCGGSLEGREENLISASLNTAKRGDSAGIAGGGVRRHGGGTLHQAWDQSADVLLVEEEGEALLRTGNGQNLALEREHSPANFIEEPGVLKLGHKETKYKRRYITLRIPERIALRVHRRLQVLP